MADNSEFVRSIQDATFQMIMEMTAKMDRACLVVETQAKKDCPVDNGILRASITSETEVSETEIVGRIGSNLEYAPYVHNGTGIYARDGNGRKTPWLWKGTGKYAGWHWTKGQRPQPFLLYAQLFNRDKIERILGG